MLIGQGMLSEMIDCPAKWRHSGGPHVPNVTTVKHIGEQRVAVCVYCTKPVFANVTMPSPYHPLHDAFLIEMTMGLVWFGEQRTFVIVEELDLDDLL